MFIFCRCHRRLVSNNLIFYVLFVGMGRNIDTIARTFGWVQETINISATQRTRWKICPAWIEIIAMRTTATSVMTIITTTVITGIIIIVVPKYQKERKRDWKASPREPREQTKRNGTLVSISWWDPIQEMEHPCALYLEKILMLYILIRSDPRNGAPLCSISWEDIDALYLEKIQSWNEAPRALLKLYILRRSDPGMKPPCALLKLHILRRSDPRNEGPCALYLEKILMLHN